MVYRLGGQSGFFCVSADRFLSRLQAQCVFFALLFTTSGREEPSWPGKPLGTLKPLIIGLPLAAKSGFALPSASQTRTLEQSTSQSACRQLHAFSFPPSPSSLQRREGRKGGREAGEEGVVRKPSDFKAPGCEARPRHQGPQTLRFWSL
jgi:hypothetical protein